MLRFGDKRLYQLTHVSGPNHCGLTLKPNIPAPHPHSLLRMTVVSEEMQEWSRPVVPSKRLGSSALGSR